MPVPSQGHYGFHSSVCNNPIYNEIINGEITEKEIVDALKGLKNSKSPGLDNVLNEYLKNSPSEYILVFKNIFNLVLDSGIIPFCLSLPENFFKVLQ
jgi:hypothetical protein